MSLNVNSSYEEVLSTVKIDGMELEHANAQLRDNKEICLAAVKQCGDALEYCSQRLRDDYELALAAIVARNFRKSQLGYSDAWKFVSERLKNEYDFILDAIEYNHHIALYIPQNLLSESYFMEKAVQRSGTVIQYASPEIKQDRKIVLKASKQNGWFLNLNDFAEYLQDREIALAACCSDSSVLEFIPDEFKKDKPFVAEVIRSGGNWPNILDNISEEVLFDDDVFFDHNVLVSACLNNTTHFVDYLLAAHGYGKLTTQILEELESACANDNLLLERIDVVRDLIFLTDKED